MNNENIDQIVGAYVSTFEYFIERQPADKKNEFEVIFVPWGNRKLAQAKGEQVNGFDDELLPNIASKITKYDIQVNFERYDNDQRKNYIVKFKLK